MRSALLTIARSVRDAVVDLHAPLAGAALGLVLDFSGASGQATILGALGLTIGLWLFEQLAVGGRRTECGRRVALAVRGILDRHLQLTRFDPVGFGDFLTLRHLAAAARGGRLGTLVSFGGPAQTLERVLGELIAELEDEVGRCYVRLPPRGQVNIDMLAAALRRACAAAAAMVNVPRDPNNREAAIHRVKTELAAAIAAVVESGDALDSAFDPKGSRGATIERATSAAEKQRVEGHAAAVLLRSARDAAQTLQLPHVQGKVPMVPLAHLRERLARAAEQLRDVDARAFREATDDARHTFRRIQQHDIDDAIEAAARLADDPADAEAEAVVRHRLGRFPGDLATLESVRDGWLRDVPPWPGFQDPDTPTLRAK